jgi:hypothetical protein
MFYSHIGDGRESATAEGRSWRCFDQIMNMAVVEAFDLAGPHVTFSHWFPKDDGKN